MKRILLALATLFAIGQSFGAVTANSVVTPQTPNRGIVQFFAGYGYRRHLQDALHRWG